VDNSLDKLFNKGALQKSILTVWLCQR